MTPKQILDSFSETLFSDNRILSAPERALITNLLQHAKSAAGTNHETQEAVRAVIASAIGETVAQRAFAVLGGSIVERILEGSSLTAAEGARTEGSYELQQPQPPGTPIPPPPSPSGPQTPRAVATSLAQLQTPRAPTPPSPGPQTPGKPMPIPGVPSPGPQTPGHAYQKTVVSQAGTAVAEKPETLQARCVVLDEFLAPQELEELTHFTLEQEASFHTSEVVSPSPEAGIVNYDHRRSRVLEQLDKHEEVMLTRIKSVLPQVLQKLGMEYFDLTGAEVQVTASNDGDFFHFHSDNGNEQVAARHLTFVYFFHREPRQFEGGELRIHDAKLRDGLYVSQGSYESIVPRQNQIVFFPCELMHEISPVKCPSRLFADSRFTVNGWLRR